MFMTSNQKQAAYYEQEQYWHGKVKSLDATIVLSLNEITQTDGKKSGIFRHTDRNKIDGDYAIKQIVGII